jgi:hypothetical protein
MRRMLGTVALLGVAARLAVLWLPLRFDTSVYSALLYLGFFAAGGAAIGCIEGRLFKGALYGVLMGFIVGMFMGLWFGSIPAARE